MSDQHGYPTDEELKFIKEWTYYTMPLLDFLNWLQGVVQYGDWCLSWKGKNVIRVQFHTGGWSGNEEIIDTLMENTDFWSGWKMTKSGGHYYFKFNLKNIYKKDEHKKRK